MQDLLYVILRETGEYDEYWSDPIRYALTEEEAKAACEKAEMEGATLTPLPYPVLPFLFGHMTPDGVWHGGSPGPDRSFERHPTDDAAIDATRDRLIIQYREACLAMGCVDPEGPNKKAEYSYVAVRPLPPTT